ncbi:MAG: metal-dependent hydrolase [Myxococcaceae bacterium]|nr:metal-dependent hydrolase [Myxococcaceae bacterium]
MFGRIAGVIVLSLAISGASFAQGEKPAETKKAPSKTTATWWGHAAWIIETPGGARIAIDPWLKNPNAPKDAKWPDQLDAILVSHGHFDHVGDAVELAKKTGAPIYGSFELVNLLNANPEKDVGANIGGTFQIKDVTLHIVEAAHSSGFGDPKTGLKYGGPATGFVLEIAKGPTLYHAGDTGVFATMEYIQQQFHPTVAMLPIGGHFTMDPAGAALAEKILKAKTLVPMHYGTFPLLTGTPDQLKAELKKARLSAKVVAPKPGESITF